MSQLALLEKLLMAKEALIKEYALDRDVRSLGTSDWGQDDCKTGSTAWHDVNGSGLCEKESCSVVSNLCPSDLSARGTFGRNGL